MSKVGDYAKFRKMMGYSSITLGHYSTGTIANEILHNIVEKICPATFRLSCGSVGESRSRRDGYVRVMDHEMTNSQRDS